MNPIKQREKDKKLPLILLLGFFVPLVIACAALYLNKVAPFGDRSILVWDAKLQYKDYYGYLWDILHGNASFEYSASKSLGGATVGLVAYYLTCPLNLLLYFIDKTQISLFFTFMTVAKIDFAGLTVSYFIRKRFKVNAFFTVLLSVCYALMEYNVVYCRNIMWLDGVVLLPLACLGVYELLYNNKKSLLFFSVFIAIFSNWYSGYMVCLMTGFYFLFELVIKYDYRNFKAVIGSAVKDAVKVLADMILGVLASGALLVPALLSLVGGKAGGMKLLFTTMNFGILECFKGFDIYAKSNESKAPIMYCGAIVMLLAVYLFFDKRIQLKKRVCSFLFFMFMICSFCFTELDVMWTAFVRSYSYAFRWAFTFAFLMIVLASGAVAQIQKHKLDKSAMLKALGVIGVVFLLLDLNGKFTSRFVAYVYIAAVLFYAALLFAMSAIKSKKAAKALCLLLVCIVSFAELGANATVALKGYNDKEKDYESYTSQMGSVINDIKASDSSLYRIEKDISYIQLNGRDVADSEGFLFNYNGVESYTSTYDANVDMFMAKIGYSDPASLTEDNQTEKYNGPTDVYWNSPMLLTDSLLGIKYQILNNSATGLSEYSVQSDVPNNRKVYKNDYALPFAYNVSDKAFESLEYTANPFENQQLFLSALTGSEEKVYSDADISYKGLKGDSEKFTVTATASGPMYFYCDPTDIHSDLNKKNCELIVNGDSIQPICTRFRVNAVYIGEFEKGENVDIEILHKTKSEKEHNIFVSTLDKAAFEGAYSALSSGSKCELNVSGSRVFGTYETDNDSNVILTLPYTEGWSLYVDGKKCDYQTVGNTFIGFNLSAGSHTVEMKYTTLHRNAGLAASFLGFTGFAAWCIVEATQKKKQRKAVK